MATTSTPEENEPTAEGSPALSEFPSAMIDALVEINPQPQATQRFGFASRASAPEPVITVIQAPGFDENGNEVTA